MRRRNINEPSAIFERGELDRDKFLKLALERGFLYKTKRDGKELLWKPSYLAYALCNEGCLNSLGMDIYMAWLNDEVGHVLIINIHDTDCYNGPNAWGDIDLNIKSESNHRINKKQESVWKELNNLLNEIYPAIAGIGITSAFMSSLAKMINNVILQAKGLKKNSPTLKLGYWRSSLN